MSLDKRETLIKVLSHIASINDERGTPGTKVRTRVANAVKTSSEEDIEDIYRRLGEEIQLKTIGITGGEII